MKLIKVLTLALLLAIGLSSLSYSSEADTPGFAISIDPFATITPLLFGGIGAAGGVEFALSPNFAVMIDGVFCTFDYSFNWILLEGFVRYYFLEFKSDMSVKLGGYALRGLYAGVGGGIELCNINWTTTGVFPALGLRVGYKWVFSRGDSGFYLEPSVGCTIVIVSFSGLDNIYPSEDFLRLNFGYAF